MGGKAGFDGSHATLQGSKSAQDIKRTRQTVKLIKI